MRVEQAISLIIIILIPLLVSGFCWWLARRIPLWRTPHNTRFLARKVTPLIVINVGIAIACLAIGIIGFTAMLIESADLGWILFWGGYVLFALVLGDATRPLFKIRAGLRTDCDDENYSQSTEAEPVVARTGLPLFSLVLFAVPTLFVVLIAFVTPVGAILIALFFGLIPLLFWQRGRAREGQFLWLLALSVRNNHNLAQNVQDHAATWSGSYAARLMQLAVYLKAGRPLGLALVRVPGLLPHWVVASIRIGDETGTLSEVLNECATTQLNWVKERFRTGSIGSLLIYLACYPWVILAPVSFMMYFIVPKMKAIFEGFDTELPGVTATFIRACDTWLGLISVVSPFAFMATLLLLRFDYSGWRNVRTGLFRRFYPRYDTSPIMRHLARMIEKGKTLPDSLLAIANSYHRPSVAETMAEVYVDTESGGDCWKSLLKRGFLSRRDLALIEAAQRVGNLPWALREIADVREKRYVFRVDTMVQLLRPVPIVAVGLLVAWVCIAMFMPIVKLVNDLSIEKI